MTVSSADAAMRLIELILSAGQKHCFCRSDCHSAIKLCEAPLFSLPRLNHQRGFGSRSRRSRQAGNRYASPVVSMCQILHTMRRMMATIAILGPRRFRIFR